MSAVPMLNLEDMPQEQLMAVAQDMLVNKRTSEKVIYYRNPTRTPDGRPHHEPGWIHWGDSQEHKQVWEWAKGRMPLGKYGPLQSQAVDNLPQPTDMDRYGPWGPILCHPDGPAEFPVEQILSFGWYDPKHCPVPGVKFPQLKQWVAEGNEIIEYECPDCNSVVYREARFLGRHLRNTHGWDRAEIIAWADSEGINLRREFHNTRSRRSYDYDDSPPAAEAQPEAEPEFIVKTVTASRKSERTPEEVAEARRRMELVRQARKPRNIRKGRAQTPGAVPVEA